MTNISVTNITQFQDNVWHYYDQHGRTGMPWRDPVQMALPSSGPRGGSNSGVSSDFDPYKVMVSELMLQQTQVSRVIPKYESFVTRFPTVQTLAAASLGDVLIAWQGLGYNRRAKFLWQAAQTVAGELDGVFPGTLEALVLLPGIGPNTAGAIMAYAYDEPVVFIETNIRTVFIHHFFHYDVSGVHDKEIAELVRLTLPARATGDEAGGARLWYWALMDYGTHLKQTVGNKSRASKSYARQSPFHGSRRQVRGAVIRRLSERPLSLVDLATAETDARLPDVLADLVREGMVRLDDGRYSLA